MPSHPDSLLPTRRQTIAAVPVDEGQRRESPHRSSNPGLKSPQSPCGVMARNDYLWQHNTEIRYSYLSGTDQQHKKVDDILLVWTYYSNLTFKRVPADGYIRISFDNDQDSWSDLGMDCLNRPLNEATMNLRAIGSAGSPTVRDNGLILHEFGHAIGFQHEHQSPARHSAFNWIEDVVLRFYTCVGWSTDQTYSNVINTVNDMSNFSPFDYQSIMMYPVQPSHTRERIAFPQNNKLSDIDKAYAMVHYPRLVPHHHAPEWTLSHALDILGVQGAFRANILCSRNLDEICDLFTDWNSSQTNQNSLVRVTPSGITGFPSCHYHKDRDDSDVDLKSQQSLSRRVLDQFVQQVGIRILLNSD